MLDKGFRIVKRADPGASGSTVSSVEKWEFDVGSSAAGVIQAGFECREKYAPPYVSKTEAEIREIYGKWVTEHDCLRALGYSPASPPTVEKFIAAWQTGPWMPTDGLDTRSWNDAQFKAAKDACGLEMVDRD